MSKQTDYQKPELKEYSHFGIVTEGSSPAAPGEERTDTDMCNVSGLEQN